MPESLRVVTICSIAPLAHALVGTLRELGREPIAREGLGMTRRCVGSTPSSAGWRSPSRRSTRTWKRRRGPGSVHDERLYSYVGATSFALMRRRRIIDALAFHDDFAAAGFNELRASEDGISRPHHGASMPVP